MGLLAGAMCEQMYNSTSTTPFPQYFGILSNNWLGLTALAMLSSLLMLVLVYMFASFIRNQQLMSWTKFELFQVLATAVVVLFTSMAIVFGMCHFDMSFLGEGSTHATNRYLDSADQPYNMYQIVENYFDYLEQVGILLFGYLMYVVKQINFLAKVMWLSSPLGVGSSESPLESIGQLNNMMFLMVSGYVISFLLLHLQMRMLDYLAIALPFYIYPFGVFFRAFEPTRNFGGTMVGLSIALFLFYPIIIVFNDYIVYSALSTTTTELRDVLQNKASIPGNQLNSDEATAQMMNTNLQNLAEMEQSVREAEYAGFSSGIAGGILFLLKPLMLYFIGAVLLPVINFIVLVEITRGATAFFGEEIDITNLTRMI